MTTNPDSIVRVRARNGGRASVYEANAWAQSFSTGVMDGAGVRQNTSADMNVLVGGTTTNPDVVIASNPAGYKIALDIVGTHTVAITAPASNKRIASVVAYTDDLSIVSTETSVTGSPASCGLIVVNGDTSSSPVAPTDAMIRAAITADGATGTQASYAVIANVAVDSSTSMVTDSLITNVRSGVTSDKIDFTTFEHHVAPGILPYDTPPSSYHEVHRYTVTQSGLFVIDFSVQFANNGGGNNCGYCDIWRNPTAADPSSGGNIGRQWVQVNDWGSARWQTCRATSILRLTAGDVISVSTRSLSSVLWTADCLLVVSRIV